MGKSSKEACVLFLMIGLLVGSVAWVDDRPNTTTWAFRIGGPVLAIFSIGFLFSLEGRKDLAHDYLHDLFGEYFNREGFCFCLTMTKNEGVGYFELYFQNQYSESCSARVTVRPAVRFISRPRIPTIDTTFICEPGAFGRIRFATSIPKEIQGEEQNFEVGASVTFPGGRGDQLRFRDGMPVGTSSNTGKTLWGLLMAIGAAAGAGAVISRGASVTIVLPDQVADSLEQGIHPKTELFWKHGDPPLDPYPKSDKPPQLSPAE